jgi:hypothetical protein
LHLKDREEIMTGSKKERETEKGWYKPCTEELEEKKPKKGRGRIIFGTD